MLKYLTHKLQTHTIDDDTKVAPVDLDSTPSPASDSDERLDNTANNAGGTSNQNSVPTVNQANYCSSSSNNGGRGRINLQGASAEDVEEDIDSELDFPMSSHDQRRAPEDATADDLVATNNTMYEQNNSSEEELEVIINGQTPFSRTTPDEFSDTGDDEEGVVYEIKAVAEPVTAIACAVNVTEDQSASDTEAADADADVDEGDEEEDESPRKSAGVEAPVAFRRPSTAEKRKRPIDDHDEEQQPQSMFDLLPGPPLNFCTSPPLEALKPHRSHSTTHILMQSSHMQQQQQTAADDNAENMDRAVVDTASDKNQSTNRRLSGPIDSSARHFYVSNNCPGFKPAAIMRRSFRTDPMTGSLNHHHHHNNERWTMVDEGSSATAAAGDDGDSEVERFNFEGIQISYSSPSLPAAVDKDSVSPPAAKLFHCAAPGSPKRRPLKHHNHQRLQRPCLDFDKMQQLKTRPVTSWRHNNEGEMFCW